MQEWHALRHRRTRETIGRKVRQTRLLRETGRRKALLAFDWSMSAPTATTLAFAPEFASTEFRLVELPAHVWDALGPNALYGVCLGARLNAQYANHRGSRVVIKGDADDDAVLCTDAQTFSIKVAETSNTIYLVPPHGEDAALPASGTQSRRIIGTAQTSFELARIRPAFSRLKGLLNQAQYAGEQAEVAGALVRTELIGFKPLLHFVFPSCSSLRAGSILLITSRPQKARSGAHSPKCMPLRKTVRTMIICRVFMCSYAFSCRILARAADRVRGDHGTAVSERGHRASMLMLSLFSCPLYSGVLRSR